MNLMLFAHLLTNRMMMMIIVTNGMIWLIDYWNQQQICVIMTIQYSILLLQSQTDRCEGEIQVQ